MKKPFWGLEASTSAAEAVESPVEAAEASSGLAGSVEAVESPVEAAEAVEAVESPVEAIEAVEPFFGLLSQCILFGSFSWFGSIVDYFVLYVLNEKI